MGIKNIIFQQKHNFLLIFQIAVFLNANFIFGQEQKQKQDRQLSADGPYIIYQPDGKTRIISVDLHGKVNDTVISTRRNEIKIKVIDPDGRFPFEVKLHDVDRPQWKYPEGKNVFVMADPHGRLDCVVSLLQANNIIDKYLNWSFGNNHLIVIGDVFDRGDDVLQIFWLLYKLEEEAKNSGGHVSLLLGNHEAMVLANDIRYTTGKYKELSNKLGVEYAQLFALNTELGRWIGTRNTIEVVGKNLYVHAGLSSQFYYFDFSIPTVNEEISRAIFLKKNERKSLSPMTAFLYGSRGPLWYRGMVRQEEKYDPISSDVLDKILDKYKIKRIIVGHTIFEDITTFYQGRVVGINVNNKKNMEQSKGRALLIHNDEYYVVGDNGIQRKLYED